MSEKVIETAISDLDKLIAVSDEINSLGREDYIYALDYAMPFAEKVAVRELLMSYAESGVQTKSGAMLNAVRNAGVRVASTTGKGKIEIYMKLGKGDNFYRYANSVNYGRVNSKDIDSHTKTINTKFGQKAIKLAGQKTKKNLKNKVQSNTKGGLIKSGRSISFIGGSVKENKSGSKEVETTLGKATITKAFKYFYLSPGQKASVRIAVYKHAKEYLDNILAQKLGR